MTETFKIYRWDTSEVIADVQAETLREAIERLVADGKNLYRASLDGGRLDGASLVGARLVGARLDRARLDRASLDGAILDGAILVGASLVGASLDGASLDGASLDGASLDGASLVGARLVGARLVFFKNDLWNVLLHAIPEIDGLVLALREGRVDGSVYEGDCACLLGTIANVRHCDVNRLENLQRDSSRAAEQWFMAIRKGDTPEKSNVVQITLEWIDEFKRLLPV